MRVLSGTSGFSYAAWRGSFYPPRLPANRMLSAYAARLTTVEINATFYRLPRTSTLASWREAVPPGFVFALKGSRRVTHIKRLADVGEEVAFFHRTALELGPALGPVLWQLPPTAKRDVGLLTAFLAALPRGGRTAIELRHATWFTDDVLARLSAAGVALCIADDEGRSTPIVATAPFGYLRLRRADYDAAALAGWAEQVLSRPWEEAFVFFKHEEEARGPENALRFGELVRGGAELAAHP